MTFGRGGCGLFFGQEGRPAGEVERLDGGRVGDDVSTRPAGGRPPSGGRLIQATHQTGDVGRGRSQGFQQDSTLGHRARIVAPRATPATDRCLPVRVERREGAEGTEKPGVFLRAPNER